MDADHAVVFLRRSWYWVGACALFVLLVAYSSYRFTESPPTWYDEGLYIQAAHSLEERGVQSIQIAPQEFISTEFITGGYPFLLPVALSMRSFGDTLFAARLPMILFMIGFVTIAWVSLYRISSKQNALLAVLLLVTFPLLYGNGKNVLGEVPGLFYSMLAFLFLWRLESQKFEGISNYLLLGFAAGLAAATKPVFFLLPVAIALVLLLHIRTVFSQWKKILFGLLAFTVPILLWVYLQFGAETNASNILSYYVNPYAVSFESITDLVLRNALRFFTETTPFYCFALIFLWATSFCVRLYQGKKIVLAEESAFVFSFFILLAYLRTAGWYRYFFEAMTLALLFAPHSLRIVTDAAGEYWLRLKKYLVFAPALFIALAGIQFYQLNYSSWVADYYESKETATLEKYFSLLPQDKSIFVYNSPEVVPFIRGTNYYQFIQPTPVLAYGSENLFLLSQGVPDEVIITPSAYAEHRALFKRYTQKGTVGSYVVLEK